MESHVRSTDVECSPREAPSPSRHLVWDWNGTLLHDTHAVIEATNAAFGELNMPTLTVERYRELYCVPVPRFYERLMGRLPSEEEFVTMEEAFHRHYSERVESAMLTEGAAELLAASQAAGVTQSLCSLASHEHLVTLVRQHRIDGHFLRVDGNRSQANDRGKAAQMARHLKALTKAVGAAGAGIEAARTVVIGDALDDARAAAHVGAYAVLYTGGSHSRRSLAEAGVPVVDSLAEAVETAERLVA